MTRSPWTAIVAAAVIVAAVPRAAGAQTASAPGAQTASASGVQQVSPAPDGWSLDGGGAPGLTPAEPAAAGRTGTSYRGAVMATDLASYALLIAAIPAGSGEMAALGGVGVALGGPIVHAAKGNGAGAFRSLVLRTVVPIAVGVAATYAASRTDVCDDSGSLAGVCYLSFGAIVGGGALVAGTIYDWAVLTRLPRETPAATRPARRTWSPVVSIPAGGGASLSVAGSW